MLSKPQHFTKSRTNLQDIVNQLIEQEKDNYAAHGVSLVAELPSDPVWVCVDRDKFKQALLNLTKNGVEAIEADGQLTLRISVANDRARIEVEDSGPGIPEDLDVFALFATTKVDGSGLGLPIVRQLVSAHDGELSYVSTPGIGTRFVIELPTLSALSTLSTLAAADEVSRQES